MKDVNLLVNNGVNINKSLELFGDIETYNDSLKDFQDEVGTKLSNISNYKGLSDMKNYAILVHSLKSDSKYFGFEKLAELSYNHEMESKAGNVQYVNDHYDELVTEANKIVNLVNDYMAGKTSTSSKVEDVIVPKEVVHIDGKAILIADDSSIILNFVKKIFANDYTVLEAKDGEEAIDIITENADNISCMLLDLNMPRKDGYEVLEYMEKNDLFKKIPVSIITGNDTKDSIDRVFTYPIVDVLQKPFNDSTIKNMVEKTMSNK